jgi:hypothetical protein
MTQWQPIATAPRDATLVLLCVDRDMASDFAWVGVTAGYWDDDGEAWQTVEGELAASERYGPHWWAPLPNPPGAA